MWAIYLNSSYKCIWVNLCAKLVSYDPHIEELIRKFIIYRTKSTYFSFHEFMCRYKAKHDKKHNQHF
jgi:hypothetical protein